MGVGAGGGERKRETFLVLYTGNGNTDSKWWSPMLSFIVKT
jgi:hypothetical protein